jgi:hypothetical protein
MCKKLKPENVLTIVFVAVLVLVVVFAATAVHGTEVSRQRTYDSERNIERIVGAMGLGVLFGDLQGDELELARGPTFYVDGEQTTIWWALSRTLLYSLDLKQTGHVQWAYVLRYDDLTVQRWTIVQDGYIHGITILPQPMARMSWARLDTYARESASGTSIRNVLTISTPYGNRCGLVRRIVHKEAKVPMDNALWKIENEALSLFEQGRTSPIARSFVNWYLSRSGRR